MSKHTLSRKMIKELERLNDRIDRNIIKGRPYQDEARRHRELLAAMRHLSSEEECPVVRESRRTSRVGKSPVRRSLAGGSFLRMFRFGIA
jgi:hypothetical protein